MTQEPQTHRPSLAGRMRTRPGRVALTTVAVLTGVLGVILTVVSGIPTAGAATPPAFSLPTSKVDYVGRSIAVPIVVTGGNGTYSVSGGSSNERVVSVVVQGGRDAHHGSLRLHGLTPGTATLTLTLTSAGKSTTHSMTIVIKPGIEAPSVVRASFGPTTLALTWNAVAASPGYSAADHYLVTVRATGVAGPVVPVKVATASYRVSYNHILGSVGRSPTGYTVQVASVTKAGLVSGTREQKVGGLRAGAAGVE